MQTHTMPNTLTTTALTRGLARAAGLALAVTALAPVITSAAAQDGGIFGDQPVQPQPVQSQPAQPAPAQPVQPQPIDIADPSAVGDAAQDDAAEEEMITFDEFSEPVEIAVLVNTVAEILDLNMRIDAALSGTIVFNDSVEVRKDRLLGPARCDA